MTCQNQWAATGKCLSLHTHSSRTPIAEVSASSLRIRVAAGRTKEQNPDLEQKPLSTKYGWCYGYVHVDDVTSHGDVTVFSGIPGMGN